MLQYEIALFAASLTLFINYCIGKPGSEFSPYEIFSNYTVWISKLRLKRIGLLDKYQDQYSQNVTRLCNESLDSSSVKNNVIQLENDYKKLLYEAADPYFTWERAVGMCPVCTGFWISLATGLIFTQNILALAEIIVVSHVVIRTLNKLL